MDFAKSQELIAVNPTDSCALPTLEHQEMKTIPVEQLATFLRRGEFLGLKMSDSANASEKTRV